MQLLEDTVIGIFADGLREQGGLLLAEGGNQLCAFHFLTSTGHRKAPDLVSFLGETLTIFEAKVKPGDLFRSSSGSLSDFQVVCEVLANKVLQQELIEEAVQRLSACGHPGVVPKKIGAGLIASGSIIGYSDQAKGAGLTLVNVDPKQKTWIIEES